MTNTMFAPSISLKEFVQQALGAETLNFWMSKINPVWSVQRSLGKIVERHVEAKDSVTLVIKPNKNAALPQAGQHIMISAEVNGVRIARSYSTRAVKGKPALFAMTVKQVEGGKLSTWLCQQAKIGDVLHLGQPFGELQFPADQQPVLLLAAGSGITPMISLLQQQKFNRLVQLHYWVKTREEACFVAEFLALQQTQPAFSFHLHLTQQSAEQTYEQQGRIQAEQFAIDDLTNAHVLVCGPAGFVATAQQMMQSHVLSWQAEAFSPPILKAADSTETIEITLQQQQRTLTVPVGQSILSALEAEGISHPVGCRMGLCNSCACGKVSGTTKHLISGVEQHEADSALRVCVSTARSNLVLDI